MKIMFITAKYHPEGAGAGRSVRNLACGMVKAGHESVVVRLTKDKKASSEIQEGVRIHHLPIRNIYWLDKAPRNKLVKLLWHMIDAFNPLAMRDIARLIDAEKPDIVNTNIIAGFSTGIFYTIKKKGPPLVHTMRDYYLLCTQSAMFLNGRDMEGLCPQCVPFVPFRRRAAKSVDMFLANSDYVLARHKKFGFMKAPQKAHTQWNMNDDDDIAVPKELKNETIRFGYIGRLNQTKGLEVLLEAVQAINTKDWVLKIAGKGEEQYVASLQENHPDTRIKYLGFTSPDDFYNDIDILICPSVYGEPLPRVVYEAYRFALPVIASDMGGTPEIVDDGITGFSYKATDSKALATLMDRIANDPALYQALSKGAAKKAELFTKTKITAEFLTKIESLLKDKAA